MARIDEVCERYEVVTNKLFSDKDAFTEYLRFAGKFFKLPSAQSMLVYGANPNAAMVADYDTWKKFDRQVKRGTSSIAVLDNGSLKHYFDISQTAGSKTPYQWQLDKNIAAAFIEETFENEGKRFNSLSGCVNYLGSEKARESLTSVIASLNIPEENRVKFEKSYISMVQFFIAARCELGGGFKYSNKPDLSALDMLHSKAEKEKLCEFVQITGKSVLLSMEKSINNIIIQGRTVDNGRNKTDMVRGRSDVLPRNQDGERQNVQVRPDDVRVSGTVGAGSDGGRTGSDERGNREIRGEMAGVYDGKSPRDDTVAARSPEMGLDTPTSGQRGDGVSGAVEETVREREPAPDNIQRADSVGEHVGNDNRQGDNGGHSADLSGISGEENERATYSTNSTTETEQTKAEDNSPAFSVGDIQKIADNISAISNALGEKYDGEYKEFTLANYTFAHSGAEYDLNKSARENVEDMLSRGEYQFLVGYLKAVYDEAFESRIIIAEGQAAAETMPLINNAEISKDTLPTITCEWSESRVFEDGKTYSVYEFDRIMKQADDERVAGTKAALEKYGSFDNWYSSDDEDYIRFMGYDKVKFTVNLPDGTSFTERQDIGDGFGGVIDFLSQYPQHYGSIIPILEQARKATEPKTESEKHLELPRDIDKFYVNKDNESVTWVYFNPDSDKGGQLVYHHFTFDQLFDCLANDDVAEAVTHIAKTELVDVDDPAFMERAREFLFDRADFVFSGEWDITELSAVVEPTYSIFQLYEGRDDLRDYRFSSISELKKWGLSVDRENYNRVYRGRLKDGETLEDLYTKFNVARPDDFRGHSLSISDIIAIKQDGKEAAHYVDDWGFEEIHDFFLDIKERKAEQAEKTDITSMRHISTIDGTGYFFMEKPLSRDLLSEIKERCEKYIIAAPAHYLSEDFLNEHNITFVKLDRDISRDIFEKPSYEITPEMDAAVTRVIEDKATDILSEVRGGKIAEIVEPAEDEPMIANARKQKIDNIRLIYDEQRGYHLKGDKGDVKDAVLTVFGQNEQAVREYLNENAVEINLVEGENPIHFGLLGNGITVYDTSKWDKEINDYPTMAHISNEGVVKYYVDKNSLKAADIERIEQVAVKQKQQFTEEWEKLPIDTRFSRIVDQANGLLKSQRDVFFADEVGLGIEGIVKKYEHPLIFRDEDFPAPEKPLIAYPVGNFYEFYSEDAHTVAEMLDIGLTERRGVPMTGFPAYDYDNSKRKLALQGYYLIEGDIRDIEKWLTYASNTEPQVGNNTLEIAKKNISDFCQAQYGDEADFSDLHNIGIAYTTVENGDDMLTLQVKADIIDCAIRYYVNNELYKEETYPNLRKMNNEVLSALDFDGLYGEFSDVVAEFEQRQTIEQAEPLPQNKVETEHISENTPTQPFDDLKVGDFVRGDGQLWKITDISGDFSIRLENTDKSSNLSEQSIIGKWKEKFIQSGYEYVLPSGLTLKQVQELNTLAEKVQKAHQSPKAEEQEYIGEQLSLFGEPVQEPDVPKRTIIEGIDIEEVLTRDLIQHGTMFEDGKFRVAEYYYSHKGDIKDFAKMLAKEYGISGHSGDGKIGYTDYNNKGITITIKLDSGEKTKVNWSWQKVANRLATLIDKQEYITQRDIDNRIKRAEYAYKHYEQGTPERERAEKILDLYGMLPSATPKLPDQQDVSEEKPTAVTVDRSTEEKPTEQKTTDKPVEIKNLAQLKRVLTVGAEFEITSHIRPENNGQLRRINYADTTGIYSIRPDAPDDKSTTLANGGRGSYLQWGKATEWDFANNLCTLYQKDAEHTPENVIMSFKIKPKVLDKEHSTDVLQDINAPSDVDLPPTEQAVEENTEVKLRSTVIDLQNGVIYDTDYQPPNAENIKRTDTVETNPIIVKLAKAFSPETAEQLYNAFESHKMDEWDGNQAKINRVKRALYDILGNEEQTERAFGIITSANQKPRDFTITDEHLGEGGAKTKYAANIAAIRTLKTIETEDRLATPEEQEILSKYVGWGGIPQAFDGESKQWENEYSELKELLSDEEYNAAKVSVLNAHYTTPTVIRAIYKGLENLGFEGGNILEPSMGVGNFFGAMPEEMRKNSNLNGVELDSISGRIAKQLYQTADIQVKGFEKTDFSDNFFDAVVGNVPFGNYPVSDKRYNRENFFIHNYFIAKSLDKVAPNGIVAVVTTKGTLDKENPKVREYLAKRADLIGAIRLPNNAFKANAGTEVTADILFFQKREKMAVEMPDWCYVSQNADGIPVNNYFIEHPEMILGEMKQGVEFSLYGNSEGTACVPLEGANLEEQLEKAVGNLKLNNALRIHKEQREKQIGVIPATADVRNFTFAEVDGKMYFRENNIMTEVTDKNGQPLTGKKLDRLKALNELRKTFRTILTEQENDCSDVQLQAYQKILNEQYDRFVKEYGYINDSANCQAFGKDDDYNSLCALEIVNEETKEVTKSDFFSRRTIKHYTEITHVDTPQEAMYVSVDTYGKLDFEYMGKLCDKEPQEVINDLQAANLIYLNPNKADPENPLAGWEETSEYLSGNVRNKLRDAEIAAKDNPTFQRNVEALTAVIPKRIEAGDITARIGVHWVDVEDYQQFMESCLQVKLPSPLRRAYNGEYKIEHKGWNSSTAATQINGTKRMNALEIFENLLNNRDVVVRDKVYDSFTGKERYEINIKETQLAQNKADRIKAEFARWLWSDPDRREKYVTKYNELFNSIVGRKYDGSHQTFPGMTPYIKLKPHQLDAVARAKFGGNTLLAHCVGAGKSFEMVAVTMDKKRLGLINKACVVVPKSLVGQMANEWLRLYPQAKLLTATEKDFDKDHRQKFIGRCCTGEYDAVIMSYEQFEKIPMSFEYRRDFIQREIKSLTEGISDLKGNYRLEQENRGSIKDMERVKKRLEAKLEKLIEDNGKTKDTSLTFEQLGFDSLVVDEAHNYKNGLVVTKMNRVSGVQTTPAQKSEDILMKTQYLNETYGERNILFATGTPVSNSMTELYIMQRYLRPSLLAQAGLQTFDDWASTFGEVVSKAELKPAGNGYRTKKRFAKFNNLPELMAMYKEFADIRTADMLDLPVPKIEGGKPQTIVASPNDFQVAAMKILAQRSEAVHKGLVEPNEDNMLKITGEARLLGLDARCLNPEADNYHDSKVNLCIDKVMEIYTNTTAQKGVQAIFCDIAVNGDNEQEELGDGKQAKKEKPKTDLSDEGKFSVYNYIKAELIRRGVPKDEICFAGDADTQKKQNEMRALLRSGTKRIVIASTSKLGTGANIQNKLVALHNLDIPWKPSDLEQRVGRIVRQGNENDTVQLYNYVTKDTFDAYMMNIIVTKQKFISQLMSGNTTARSCEDVDEMVLNYTEMQALATGDPRIKEKIELDTDVARLKLLESEHYNEQYRLDDTINNSKIAIHNYERAIEGAKKDVEFAKQNELPTDCFKVEIGGKVFVDRKEAGEALRNAAVSFLASANGAIHQPIGTFRGFELALEKAHDYLGGAYAQIAVRHEITYTTNLDIMGDIGNATRLDNLVNDGIGKKLADMEKKCEQAKGDLQAALENKGKPFEHADELAQKSARLNQLNIELEVGKADEVIMNDSEDESRESPDRDNRNNDRGKPKPPSRGRH